MARLLVDNGACVFATTLGDEETAAQKCEPDEPGYNSCSAYLHGPTAFACVGLPDLCYVIFSIFC